MRLFDAVLFDRDGTLIQNKPYCADPDAVEPVAGARQAMDRLRAKGLALGVVTNQSGVGRGLIPMERAEAVNARVEQLLGPFDTWQMCPHAPEDGCDCRKPKPGLIHRAARALGVKPERCIVVGDIASDVDSALAAGATGLMVPTEETLVHEVASAPAVVRDLTAAVDWIEFRHGIAEGPELAPRGRHVLVVRADNAGDVLLMGPAIRAIADRAARVTVWSGPAGRHAARLLPGVDQVITLALPWISIDEKPIAPSDIEAMVRVASRVDADEALIFTSFHQSALPTALVLKLAGVPRTSAISTDYPGQLLQNRHLVPENLPEPMRALSLAASAGYPLPEGDDGSLRVKVPAAARGRHVVLHPGGSASARACSPSRARAFVRSLLVAGYEVFVTGGPSERALTEQVAVDGAVNLGGRTSFGGLARLLASAACVVTGNTGPAHLAAALGTPVVSLFAPTVPFGRWGPYRVPVVRLGDQLAACRDSRATSCPLPGHPCLDGIEPRSVVDAVRVLTEQR
jgi:histidinol-phosphate phosphatase family protein